MALDSDALGWRALLIGGQSGAGKSTVAEALGRRLGIPWLQVDDLRLALERSRVTLPAGTEKLYFFEKTPDLWRLPPERLRDALIGIGEVMSPAIEVVVANHVAQRNPAVIEGDGILPSLMERPEVRPLAGAGLARAVFVVEPDEDVLLGNMRARGRGFNARTEAEVLVEVRAKWLYGRWLAAEARSRDLPVLAPRPWATLGERILAAAAASS